MKSKVVKFLNVQVALAAALLSTFAGMTAQAAERTFTFSSRPNSHTVILANGSDTVTITGNPTDPACFSVDTAGRVTSFALASTPACDQSITWTFATSGFEVGRVFFQDIDDLDGDTARDGFAMDKLGTWSSTTGLSTYAFADTAPAYADQKARFTASGAVGTYLSRDTGTDPTNDQATFDFDAPTTSFGMIHDDLQGIRSARLFVELSVVQFYEVLDLVANPESFASIDGQFGGTTTTVLASDTLDGVAVDPAEVTITVDSSDPELTLNPATGLISVGANTPGGTYNVTYTICENNYSPNCSSTTESVTVTAPPPAPMAVCSATGTNVATSGVASQSTTLGTRFASIAIDGNTGGNHNSNEISATTASTSPWWEVDLGSSQAIDTVDVGNITSCCQGALADFYLFTSPTPFPNTGNNAADLTSILSDPTVSKYQHSGTPGNTTPVAVVEPGRYVRVQVSGTNRAVYLAEVEVNVCPPVPVDRSDAPISGTAPDGSSTNTYGDATHEVDSAVRMGASIDADAASLASPNADGDDTNGTDDEDGVSIPTLTQGQTSNITVNINQASSNSGYLQGWIDFDGDGSFAAAEQVATDQQFAGGTAGTITVPVSVPSTTTLNPTFARFRWSTTAGLSSLEPASNGEAEDYSLTIAAAPVGSSNGTLNYPNSGTGTYLTNLALLDWETSSLSDGIDDGDVVDFPLIGCRVGTLTATFSNVSNAANAGTYVPTDMQTWSGASMYTAYNGPGTGEALYGGENADVSFTVNWAMTINGVSVSPDMYFLDAEATNGAGESLTAVTNGGNWAIVDSAVGTDYLISGVGTQTVNITRTEGPSHSPMLFSSEATQTDVTIEAGGRQGIAFAVNIPCDYGDADTGYALASHAFKQEPGATSGLQFKANEPYLGSNPPDSEIANQASSLGDGDDNTGSDDEDGVTIPVLRQGETSDIVVAVNQVSANIGYLQGWIDYDGDEVFEPGEQVATDSQLASGASGNITVSVTVPSGATTSQTFLRFRWSTNAGLGSTANASDGEVEDYAITILPATAELTAEKTVRLFDPAGEGLYALPGNDVIYTISVSNIGGAAADEDTIDLIDELPDDIEFWNGDIDAGGGSEFASTDPVAFEDVNSSGLTFTYGTDVRFSTSATKPANFGACTTIAPTSTYRPDFNFICFNPKGVFVAGDPTPAFGVSFRARIK